MGVCVQGLRLRHCGRHVRYQQLVKHVKSNQKIRDTQLGLCRGLLALPVARGRNKLFQGSQQGFTFCSQVVPASRCCFSPAPRVSVGCFSIPPLFSFSSSVLRCLLRHLTPLALITLTPHAHSSHTHHTPHTHTSHSHLSCSSDISHLSH